MKKVLITLVLALLLLSGCTSKSSNTLKPEDINPDDVVNIKDVELEKIIREQLSKPEGDILASDMEEIHSININFNETPVYDITGLEYAINLSDFSYRYGKSLVSLDPISNISTLTYLNMSYSDIDTQPALFNTPELRSINFTDSNISDYTFLKNVTSAVNLTLINDGVKSITFIKNMDKLESLNLSTNEISDISYVKDKINLTSITLHQNQVSDISVLETCTKLEDINISYNHVINISYLYNLDNLIELTAYEELDAKIIPRTQIEALIASGVSVLYHQ